MNEEIANTRDIKTKRDLLLDTLVLKGCKGRGCIKTEFREYRQPPRCQGFLAQLPAHQNDMCSQILMNFWK